MKFSPGMYGLVLALVCSTSEAATKKLSDSINTCKRNDPDLSQCFLTNFNKLLPMLKDGAPEMNIMPIDPLQVESVKVDLTATQTLKMAARLLNLEIYGWSESFATKCGVWQTSDGIQLYVETYFPAVVWKSVYNAVGSFLLFSVNTTGDFRGEYTALRSKFIGNSTRHMKNGEEHLFYTGGLIDLTLEDSAFHFSNIFGNDAALTEAVNGAINENNKMVYEEMKPVLLQVIGEMMLKIVNNFHATFPYDLLYPKE